MLKFYVIFLILTSIISCGQPASKTERENEPTIYTVTDEDREMNDAIALAHQTLSEFDQALASNNTDYDFFFLKSKFNTSDGFEHIWVSDISIRDGNYYGIVDNLPESITEVKLGDTIRIDKSTISDWMYAEGDKLYGGFTIKVLRDRMSPDERKSFDRELGFIIE